VRQADDSHESEWFVRALRSLGEQVPPSPTQDLEQLFVAGVPRAQLRKERQAVRAALRRRRLRRGALSLGLGAKLALGAAAAAVAVTGATLEPVPDVVREPARALIGQVTGIKWSEPEGSLDEPSGVMSTEGAPEGSPDRQLGGTPGGSSDQTPARDVTRGNDERVPPPFDNEEGEFLPPGKGLVKKDEGPGESSAAPGRSSAAPGRSGLTPRADVVR
jgi:hypothetical protein